jgi:hypothetical protein
MYTVYLFNNPQVNKMPKNALRKDEIEQWTHGRPNAISEILINGFAVLKETATERTGDGAEARYKVGKVDVTAIYQKVTTNIFDKFTIKGQHKLAIRELNKADIDGSALLGAYFRSSLIGADGQGIVALNEQELKAVYDFVESLVPAEPHGVTPKLWLDSFEGTAKEKHKKVLTALIFQGVSEEERASMFKEKYEEHVNNMLDSMLNIVDFMRTPLRTLDNEEAAIKLLAKKAGGVAKTSGVDLQWGSMLKAFQTSMDQMIAQKHISKQRSDAELIKDGLHETLMWCQGSFGIENTRYQMSTEFALETAKGSQAFKQIQDTLGFAEEDPETAFPVISAYVHEFRENLIKADAEKAEAIRAMPLKQLFTEYADVWQKSYDALKAQFTAAQKETSEAREQVAAKQVTIEQQIAQLDEIRVALESGKKQILVLERQFKDATEKAKLDASIASSGMLQNIELESMRDKMRALEERFRVMELRAKEAERLSQQKGSTALKLEEQVQLMTVKAHKAELQDQQLKELQLKVADLEKQLLLAKQTPEKGSNIEALEEQLREAQLQNSELLSQLKLAQTSKEPVVVEDHSLELNEMRQEIIRLKQELELAQQSKKPTIDSGKSAVMAEVGQIQRGEEALALERKKTSLSVALGEIKRSLKKDDFERILNQINDSKSVKELELPEHEIQSLTAINQFIDEINKGILKRAHWYTSDPYEKTEKIKHAFNTLTMKEKVQLMLLSDKEIQTELKSKDQHDHIGLLLHELHQNRSWIPFSEATSFTLFKSGIKNISPKISEDVRQELGLQ